MDFQKAIINYNDLKKFRPNIKKINNNLLKQNIQKTYEMLLEAKRPVIILGGGIKISKSEDELYKFLNKSNIPLITTWSGVDLIDHKSNRYIGNVGVYGSRAANFSVQNSDVLLCLGSRLDTRITGGVPSTFARKSKVIVVDIDKNELSKRRGLKINLKINSDLKIFLSAFNKFLKNKKINKKNWLNVCAKWKNEYPIVKNDYYKQKIFVNPYVFINELSKILNNKSIIIADDGGHLTWAIQAFKVKKGQKLFSAFGNSPMGYAFPASIGASIAKKKAKIICIDGDGSFQINIQELQTVVANKLPIKIIVLNNNGYGIIKQFQELYLGGRYEATTEKTGVTNPDFKKVSKAYGINYSLIKNHKNLKEILNKVIKSNKAEFIEVILKPDQKIIPKLQFGNPIEDLSPLLSRKEFANNMFIDTTKRSKKIFEAN
jgi:acetolactate synthase-1/2/3 large subunit